jgi:hypothetical protein
MAGFSSITPPPPPPYRVGREGFAQNLWRLTEVYPELSEGQIYATLSEAIFAGEIYCIVPALKDYFSAWYYVPPELSLNLGDIVVVGPGLANLDTHEWLFDFEGARLDFVLVWSDIGRVFQDRENQVREFGMRIINNFSPQQTFGRQNSGTVTQTQNNYFGMTPPVTQPPSAPEPALPLQDLVPKETSTPSAPTEVVSADAPVESPDVALQLLAGALRERGLLVELTEFVAACKAVFGCSEATARDIYWPAFATDVKAGGGQRTEAMKKSIRGGHAFLRTWVIKHARA